MFRSDASESDPSPSAATPRRRLERFAPLLLLLGALLLAAASLVVEVERRAERQGLVERIGDLDLPAHRRARLAAWAARGDDPVEIRLEAARRLVNRAVEAPADDAVEAPEATRPRNGDGEAGDTATPVPPLELAQVFAAESLARRPGSWRAANLLASSVYLQRARSADRLLVTAASDWNRPLERAQALAPAAPEPVRFQAAAYLELWPTLPPERRQQARDLLRRAMADPETFGRLIRSWLAAADSEDASLEETLAVIPPDPRAWETLEGLFASEGDWRAALEARARWRPALVADLERRLEEAATLERRGRSYDARLAYLKVVTAAPTEATFAPLVADALAAAPPGPARSSLAEPLARWLDWALELDLVGANPLPRSVDRLAGSVADLPEATLAHATVAAGDLAAGEGIARRSGGTAAGEPWRGYLVAKAGHLHRHRPEEDCGEVAEALRRLPGDAAERPSSRLAAARCSGGGDDLPGTADGYVAEESWRPVAEPGMASPTHRREIFLARPAGGFRIGGEAAGDGLVEVRLDGRVVAARRSRPGRGLEVAAEVDPGLHLVEVVSLRGGFRPGRLVPVLTSVPFPAPVSGPAAVEGAGAGGGAADGD